MSDSEAFDIESPPPKKTRDAIEHAGFIFDECDEGAGGGWQNKNKI